MEHHTSPTQSGDQNVFEGLQRVREAAQARGKQEQFTALLHHVTVDLLRESFYALKKEAGSRSGSSQVAGV